MLQSEFLKTSHYREFVMESMEGKPWQGIMDEGLSLMYEFEVQPGSGTLLGLIREEDGYIHHDTDIDIDVIERKENRSTFPERLVLLIRNFRNNGFELIRTQFYKELPSQIAFLHTSTNLIFDLCFFYDYWGTDWMNIYEHGVFIRPPYSVNNVVSYEFNNSTYMIPEDYDKYLTGRYGNWTRPKVYKESGEKDAADYLIIL